MKTLTETDYARASQVWDDRYGTLARGKRNWRLVGLAQFILLGVCILGMIDGYRSRETTPYVIEVNGEGKILKVGAATAATELEEHWIRYQLGTFIIHARTALGSPTGQQAFMDQALPMVQGDARATLQDFFHTTYNEAHKDRETAVQLRGTESVSDGLWRVVWSEELRSENGTALPVKSVQAYEAILTVVIEPPTTVHELEANPLGIHITNLRWSTIR